MEDNTSKRSEIWLHFSTISTGHAKCNICGSKYSYKGGSTSNLKKHLQSKHHTFLAKPGVSSRRTIANDQRSVEGKVYTMLLGTGQQGDSLIYADKGGLR